MAVSYADQRGFDSHHRYRYAAWSVSRRPMIDAKAKHQEGDAGVSPATHIALIARVFEKAIGIAIPPSSWYRLWDITTGLTLPKTVTQPLAAADIGSG